MRPLTHLLAVLVAGALVAACGQDDENADRTDSRTTDPAFAEFGVPAG